MADFDLTALLSNFEAKAKDALARPPENLDEALVRILVVAGNLWMTSVEPISSEMDILLSLWMASLPWADRQLAKIPFHQLRRVRMEMRDASRAAAEESKVKAGGG